MAVVAAPSPMATGAGGAGGDGSGGAGVNSQHAGLTVSLFGSGKSHIEALEAALKGSVAHTTQQQRSGADTGGATGSSGGGATTTGGGGATGGGSGGGDSKAQRRRKKKRGAPPPSQQTQQQQSNAPGTASSPTPQPVAGAANAGGSSGAGTGAGAGAGAGAGVTGAGAGAGAGAAASVSPTAGSTSPVAPAAPARPVKAIEHVPAPTDVGQASEMIMGFGDALRQELSRGLPTLEGYLIKLGGASLGLRMLKRWTRRYFVLTGPVLRYWETKSDRDALGLGGVRASYELDGAKVDSVRVPDAPFPYAVELVTASGLREYLVAEKQEHVDLWTKALRGVVDTLAAFPALHLSVAGKPRGTVTAPPEPAVPLYIGAGAGAGAGAGEAMAPATPGAMRVQRSGSVVSTPGAATRQASVRGDASLAAGPDSHDPRTPSAGASASAGGGGGHYAASVASDMSYMSSPGVHTVAVAVPVAVERPPVGASATAAGSGSGGGGTAGAGSHAGAGAVPVAVVEEHVCTKCHNALEDGDVFCDNCGTRVS